jgi:hypothetical protein
MVSALAVSLVARREGQPEGAMKLPDGMSILEAADRTRRALFEFFAGSNGRWGKRGLAEWLHGTYANAAWRREDPASAKGSTPRGTGLEELAVERLLLRTRDEVVALLETWPTDQAVDSGAVVVARDSQGSLGYVAVDRPGMTLFERVSALLFADLLTRPNDYRDHLHVCDNCWEVSFDWAPQHLGCEELIEEPHSGYRIGVRGRTLHGLGK